MGPKEWGSISGQKIKQRYVEAYNSNPNYCLFCGKVIEISDKQKPSAAKRKMFCGHSCAAKYNNKHRERKSWAKSDHPCELCGKSISRKEFSKKKKFCEDCTPRKPFDPNLTKGEFRKKSSSYDTYRNEIRRHSRSIYPEGITCEICGYGVYTEVCHIKAVKDFSDDTPLSEINSLDNLIRLCPNHHQELHLGVLNLSARSSIG